MSFLSRLIRLLKGESDVEEPRVFLQDEQLISAIKDVAKQQSRSEEEIVGYLTKVGLDQLNYQNDLDERWQSLSFREQQITALICLGHRNYEIAQILTITPETVKTHLQSIFLKFNFRSSKELRLVLKEWDFITWWKNNSQI